MRSKWVSQIIGNPVDIPHHMDMDPDLDDEDDMFKGKGAKMNDEELLRQMLSGGMMMNLPGQTPMNTHADEDHPWLWV